MNSNKMWDFRHVAASAHEIQTSAIDWLPNSSEKVKKAQIVCGLNKYLKKKMEDMT